MTQLALNVQCVVIASLKLRAPPFYCVSRNDRSHSFEQIPTSYVISPLSFFFLCFHSFAARRRRSRPRWTRAELEVAFARCTARATAVTGRNPVSWKSGTVSCSTTSAAAPRDTSLLLLLLRRHTYDTPPFCTLTRGATGGRGKERRAYVYVRMYVPPPLYVCIYARLRQVSVRPRAMYAPPRSLTRRRKKGISLMFELIGASQSGIRSGRAEEEGTRTRSLLTQPANGEQGRAKIDFEVVAGARSVCHLVDPLRRGRLMVRQLVRLPSGCLLPRDKGYMDNCCKYECMPTWGIFLWLT